jgi:hypothetical protein
LVAHDAASIAKAHRVLGVEPGVSPLAARRRYRELIKASHPDRYPPGTPAQAEATRRTQEINDAYRTLKYAAIHRETPLRRPSAATRPPASAPWPSAGPPPPEPRVVSLDTDTLTDRLIVGAAGFVLGLLIAFGAGAESARAWLITGLTFGAIGAILGWRGIEAVARLLWWLV